MEVIFLWLVATSALVALPVFPAILAGVLVELHFNDQKKPQIGKAWLFGLAVAGATYVFGFLVLAAFAAIIGAL